MSRKPRSARRSSFCPTARSRPSRTSSGKTIGAQPRLERPLTSSPAPSTRRGVPANEVTTAFPAPRRWTGCVRTRPIDAWVIWDPVPGCVREAAHRGRDHRRWHGIVAQPSVLSRRASVQPKRTPTSSSAVLNARSARSTTWAADNFTAACRR